MQCLQVQGLTKLSLRLLDGLIIILELSNAPNTTSIMPSTIPVAEVGEDAHTASPGRARPDVVTWTDV